VWTGQFTSNVFSIRSIALLRKNIRYVASSVPGTALATNCAP
jgi:hypothetical protein